MQLPSTQPMSQRRAHNKSRKGCLKCKRRKVKCDETTPACFNCTRRGNICSLSRGAGSPSSASPASGGSRRSPPAREAHLSPSIAETWGQGLELMHHYCTDTAGTLMLRPDAQKIWRSVVPVIGYHIPFVMHGILAIAAMHKAYLVPPRRRAYTDLAVYHQTAGLAGFRVALSELAVGAADWKPCFCFASMMAVGKCWQPLPLMATDADAPEASATSAPPKVLDLFVFIKGIRSVLQPYREQLIYSCLAPLAEPNWSSQVEEGDKFSAPMISFSLLPVDTLEAIVTAAQFYRTTLEGNSLEDYLSAIDALRKAASKIAAAGTEPEAGTLTSVLIGLEESVQNDIQASQPHAMVLLAYFAFFFNALAPRFWFLTGVPKKLFEVIDKSLKRFPVHQDAVNWPRTNVFERHDALY